MGRKKKDSAALNIKIETNINKKLEGYCELTGLTKTKVVEKALENYIKNKK